jgi:hypothetical protein
VSKSVQLPTLSGFGIQPPAYIHKIDRGTYWEYEEGISEGVEHALRNIFNNPDYLYSLWLVNSDLDFSCVAASLNAYRNSPNEQINFIWLTNEDLDKVGLTVTPSDEGKCLYAQKLHFNVFIEPDKAKELCYLLMENKRKTVRCTKGQMKLVVEFNSQRGCRAYENYPALCSCEMS